MLKVSLNLQIFFSCGCFWMEAWALVYPGFGLDVAIPDLTRQPNLKFLWLVLTPVIIIIIYFIYLGWDLGLIYVI